jgi:hypothetical protein
MPRNSVENKTRIENHNLKEETPSCLPHNKVIMPHFTDYFTQFLDWENGILPLLFSQNDPEQLPKIFQKQGGNIEERKRSEDFSNIESENYRRQYICKFCLYLIRLRLGVLT